VISVSVVLLCDRRLFCPRVSGRRLSILVATLEGVPAAKSASVAHSFSNLFRLPRAQLGLYVFDLGGLLGVIQHAVSGTHPRQHKPTLLTVPE